CAPDILRTIVLVSLPPRTRHDRTRALPSQRSRRLAIKAFIEPSVNERGHVSPVGCQSLRVAALVEMPQPNSTHESRKPLQYFAEWLPPRAEPFGENSPARTRLTVPVEANGPPECRRVQQHSARDAPASWRYVRRTTPDSAPPTLSTVETAWRSGRPVPDARPQGSALGRR